MMAKGPRKKQKEGARQELLLDKPRLRLPHSSLYFEVTFYTLLVLLGGFGALCCVGTAFHLPVYAGPLVAVGCVCGLLGVAQSLLPRGRLVLLGAMAFLWAVALLAFWGEAAEGACRVMNLMLQAYSERLRFPLRQFDVPGEATRQQAGMACTAFAALCMPPFFWLLSWILAKRKNALGAFCLTGAVLCSAMALSILPEFWALCMLLLFWCMLLLCATVLGRRHRLVEEQVGFWVSGAALRPAMLVLLPLTALCMLLVYRIFPEEGYERPQIANDLRSGLNNGFGLEAMLEGGQGSNNTRVDLAGQDGRAYTGKTMLRVRFDWPKGQAPALGKDYLKSFTGSVYTGGSWEKLPQGDEGRLGQLVRPGEVQGLPASFSTLLPTQWDPGLHYTLSVENKAANPRCVYIPYGLSAQEGEASSQRVEFVQDGFAQSANFFSGTRSYALNAVILPQAGMFYPDRVYYYWNEKLYGGQDQAFTDVYLGQLDSQNWETAPEGDLLLRLLYGDALLPEREFFAPGWAKEPLCQGAKRLVQVAESYRAFVLETYLQLPEETAGVLDGFRQEHGLTSPYKGERTVGGWNQEEFLEKLVGVFQKGYTYTLSPPTVPAGRDFADYFLNDSKAGYCVHFATAAVALCRSAGIPARYAEGYVAPAGSTGIWVDVPDYNAHAWLEVYSTGVGWMPVEVTPANEDAPAAYPNAQAPSQMGPAAIGEGDVSAPQEEASPSPSPTALPTAAPTLGPSPTPAGGGGSVGAAPTEEGTPLLLAALCLAGVLALLPVALWLNRQARLHLRRKAFSQEDSSRAALEIYAHLLELHKLEASLYYGERKPPPRWEELALKARFARDPLPLEELQVLAADAAKLEANLKAELPTDRRLACQYLRGLF